MGNGESQQESLETLKLINAASTSLRLYPADSAQVTTSVENAYQGVKAFLRKNNLFRFSCHDGSYLLAGQAVDNPTQERLELLTFTDHLQNMGLSELVLSTGFDRNIFRKILSVFSSTPEQVREAGGSRSYVDKLGLTAVFPEKYVADGASKDELERKQKTDLALKELSGEHVHPADLHYLFAKNNNKSTHQKLAAEFQIVDVAAHYIATATYSLVQILQKNKSVSVSPVFTKMLGRVAGLVQEAGQEAQDEYGIKAAKFLLTHLDDSSLMVLLCQDFPSPFGPSFYGAIIGLAEKECLVRVFQWMKIQHEKAEESSSAKLKVISMGYKRLFDTARGKQILAAGSTRELLAKTEEGRKTKRVQAGIKALAEGNMQSLQNDEVCRNLPSTIFKLLENDKDSLAAAIVQNVVTGLKEGESELRSSYVSVVAGVAEKLVLLKRWDWLEKLTPVCLAWLRETESGDRSYIRIVQALQAVMNHAWAVEKDDLAERILNVFYTIRSGALEKPMELRNVIARVQDENVDVAILQGYLESCFIKPVDEYICKKITMQGPVAGRFLLDTLINSERRSDRIRLLKLLSGMGAELVPVLLERLPDPMPWYGKRNIIRLLGQTGSEEDAKAVFEYMGHDDLRVQQEALRCIARIGHSSTARYFLKALPDASLEMKAQIVQYLSRVADESVVAPLAELLEDCKLYKGSGRNLLAEEICHALGASGSSVAFPVLQRILDGPRKQFGHGIFEVAENAITSIQKQGNDAHIPEVSLKERKSEKEYPSEIVEPSKALVVDYESITESAEEKEVYDLLARDKLQSAKKALLRLIEKSARQKQFNAAESLRLRLIDIDPMALGEIIKAAEYIEDVKSNTIDQNHIIIWSDLYDLLSTEEFNAFYHVLEHKAYPAETLIVNQGDQQHHLFLVNKGRVKLFYREEENEVLVKTLGHGQIFGGDSFFNDSVWTLNASSMGSVEISKLPIASVEGWPDLYPALDAKIRDYCIRMSTENEFFQATGAERRSDKREAFTETVFMELLDEQGKASDTIIRGDGGDLSLGGVSFFARINKRKYGRMLLGRPVSIHFKGDVENVHKVKLKGRVVAVRNLHSADQGRSVHICFDTALDENDFAKLIAE